MRYLARRAIKGGDGREAVRLMHACLRLAPNIVGDEPVRTGVTYAAALVRAVLPNSASDVLMAVTARGVRPVQRAAA